jgi:hypothetical protein
LLKLDSDEQPGSPINRLFTLKIDRETLLQMISLSSKEIMESGDGPVLIDFVRGWQSQRESADVVCRAFGRPPHSKLEKSSAKQTRTMNDGGTAPHHHQALEHEGYRPVGFVRVDRNV